MRKPYSLEWSPFAFADRDAIFDYIEGEEPRAAAAMDSRIGQAISSLVIFPRLGRVGRIKGTRELVIAGTPYIVAYRVKNHVVRILRILHGAQLWPEKLPDT